MIGNIVQKQKININIQFATIYLMLAFKFQDNGKIGNINIQRKININKH